MRMSWVQILSPAPYKTISYFNTHYQKYPLASVSASILWLSRPSASAPYPALDTKAGAYLCRGLKVVAGRTGVRTRAVGWLCAGRDRVPPPPRDDALT